MAGSSAYAVVAVYFRNSRRVLSVDPVPGGHRKPRCEALSTLPNCLKLHCWCSQDLKAALTTEEVSGQLKATSTYQSGLQFCAAAVVHVP